MIFRLYKYVRLKESIRYYCIHAYSNIYPLTHLIMAAHKDGWSSYPVSMK